MTHEGPAEDDVPGYWCVVCGRFLPEDETGEFEHDDIPHPVIMLIYDDEEYMQ